MNSTEQIGDLHGAAPDGSAKKSPRPTRRQTLLAAVLAAVVLVAAIAVVVASGGGQAGPATEASSIVPADALAYLNISTDRSRPAVSQALTVARRFPGYPLASAAVLARLGAIVSGGKALDFASAVRPWVGNEVAVAFLNTPSATAGSLIVVAVSNQGRARAALARWGAAPAGSYRGTPLLRYPSGTELAFVQGYLALGQDASVRAAIDVASGRASSLHGDSAYVHATAGEPADRVLDGYASAVGVQRILVSRAGALGALGALLAKPALQAVAFSLSPTAGGAKVRIHTTLDPTLAQLSGSPSAPFEPTLQKLTPGGSLLFYDTAGLTRVAPEVLRAGSAAGIGGGVGPLLQRLGSALAAEGVNVHALTSIFSGETAVAITPGASNSSGVAAPPTLVILARTRHPTQTKAELAALEVPLAQLFPAPSSGPGQAPEFNDVQIDGVAAHEISLTPGLQLDYAVFGGLLVVATSRQGIAAVIGDRPSLAGQQQFKVSVSGRPTRVSSLLFLDFSQLLSLGEQTGLTRSERLRALAPDLQRIRMVGMYSTSGEADTTAELFLQIR